MKLFAVLGNPVLHSKSPQLWNHAFACHGIDAHYFRLNPLTVTNAMTAIREIGLSGCNVTTPFKDDVVSQLETLDASAARLAAVNTIQAVDGRLIGYNTDAYGVVNSLKAGGRDPAGKRAVVLGAGGAARAAADGLRHAGARAVVMLNRTYAHAEQAAARLGCRAAHFETAPAELAAAELLIACISATSRVIEPAWLHPGLAVFDANYAVGSALLRDAAAAGCQIISGLHWLVHQAAPAFEMLLGENPGAAMHAALDFPVVLAPTLAARSIALIGFMGTGKTTVGKLLAELTGKRFVDTDTLIETQAGAPIPEIFARRGEAAFREIERRVFMELDLTAPHVISCGGGAILAAETRAYLQQHCLTVWLWSPLAVSLARNQQGARPLLEVADAAARARQLFTARAPLYAQTCDLMVVNDQLRPQDVAQTIYAEMCQTSRH